MWVRCTGKTTAAWFSFIFFFFAHAHIHWSVWYRMCHDIQRERMTRQTITFDRKQRKFEIVKLLLWSSASQWILKWCLLFFYLSLSLSLSLTLLLSLCEYVSVYAFACSYCQMRNIIWKMDNKTKEKQEFQITNEIQKRNHSKEGPFIQNNHMAFCIFITCCTSTWLFEMNHWIFIYGKEILIKCVWYLFVGCWSWKRWCFGQC